MQFGFTSGRSSTYAIFLIRQIHEKYLEKKKIDLSSEWAFDRIPREILWWAKRKLGVEDWLIRTVQAMYTNAKSSMRVNGQFSS